MEVNAIDRRATSFQGWGLQYDMGETPFYILDLFKKQLEENTQYYSLIQYTGTQRRLRRHILLFLRLPLYDQRYAPLRGFQPVGPIA